MKKNDIIDIKIENFDLKGKGYAKVDNYKVFANINVGIGQVVNGRVCKIKKNRVFLCDNKIIDYANRNNAIYPIQSKQCGGCNYQFLTYEEQFELKQNQIKNILSEVINYEYVFDTPIKSVDKVMYRNKMEFSFGNEIKDGPMILGLHKQNSFHDIVEVNDCKLMDNNFNKIYIATNEFFKKYDIPFYHRLSHIGYFRNFIIRKAKYSKSILLNLITTDQIDKKIEKNMLDKYVEMIRKIRLENEYKISGILHTINNNLSDSINSDNENILFGKRDLLEKVGNLYFNISPYSFFQTNTNTLEKLYAKTNEYLVECNKDNNSIIFDLFSGTGTISQIISHNAKKVYGIEIVEEAVEKAIENSKLNKLDNVEFIAGDVFEKLDILNNENIVPNILIVDPPRQGILSKNIEKIVKYNTKNILYISCNPNTLALDIAELHTFGYKLKKICMVDMFPFTRHMETVTLLEKE